MLPQIIKNIFGTRNSRLLKEYEPFVKKINLLEKKYEDFNVSNFSKETINGYINQFGIAKIELKIHRK